MQAREVAIVKIIKGEVTASVESSVKHLDIGSTIDDKVIIQTQANSSITIVFNDSSEQVVCP
jgi:hypothetical protein